MAHRHGGDIYSYKEIRDFSANINYRGMPETVRRAALDSVGRAVYYPDPDYRSLRAALSVRENCPAEHIICGNGAAELMFALAAAGKPKRALLAAPSFYEYEQSLQSVGCEIRRVKMDVQDGFVLPEEFLRRIDEQTDIVILGNPNNPTGRMIDSGFLERLTAVCRKNSALLVIDESFFDFLCKEDAGKTFSCVGRTATDPNLFVIRSFTKMYAMPGLRFGYGICGDTALLEQMRLVLQPWNVSVVAQAAAEAAAAECLFAEETAEAVKACRMELCARLENAGYRVYPSDTNFLLFEGPGDLQEFCLERGFLIRDCSNFPGLAKGFFRICVRSREENEALASVLCERMETGIVSPEAV